MVIDRINIFQATPPSLNPGMFVSNLAAAVLFDEWQSLDRVAFYQLFDLNDRIKHLDKPVRENTWILQ